MNNLTEGQFYRVYCNPVEHASRDCEGCKYEHNYENYLKFSSGYREIQGECSYENCGCSK